MSTAKHPVTGYWGCARACRMPLRGFVNFVYLGIYCGAIIRFEVGNTLPYKSKCALCEMNAAMNWTLYNGESAVVAPLCLTHGDYLSSIVEVVGPKPSPNTGPLPKQPVRTPKARPLDWTPPS